MTQRFMLVTEDNACCVDTDTQHTREPDLQTAVDCNTGADGLLVMHEGKVVYEYLLEGVPAWRTHGINSASKVFTGCVAAILADQGKLSWDKPLHEYAPQLKGTGQSWKHQKTQG